MKTNFLIIRPIGKVSEIEYNKITEHYKRIFNNHTTVIVLFGENETDKTTFEIIKL